MDDINRKQRRGATGRIHGREKTQPLAEVTIKVYPDVDGSSRRDNAKRRLNTREVDMVYPGGGDLGNMGISDGDMLWAYRNGNPVDTATWSAVKDGISVFATLGGLDVSPYGSSEALEEAIYNPGSATAGIDPRNAVEISSGIAAACYGSRSITNICVKPVYPGDYGSIVCPDIKDQNRLGKYTHGALGINSINPDRLTPVLEPFDFKEVRYNETVLCNMALKLNKAWPNVAYLDIIEDSRNSTPSQQRACHYQHMVMSWVYSAYEVLSNRKIIQTTFTLDGNFTDNVEVDPKMFTNGSFYEFNNLYDGSLDNAVSDYKDVKFENNSQERYGEDLSDLEFFRLKEGESLALAGMLGLISHPQFPPEETAELRSDILKSIIASETGESIYRLFLDGMITPSKSLDEKRQMQHIARNVENISHNLHQGADYINQASLSGLCGKIISGATAGTSQIVDLLVNAPTYSY